MNMEFNDEKPRRNWREIDRNKDRSKHRKEDLPLDNPRRKARSESASKVYRAKLDAFFDGGGKAPEHVKNKLSALENQSEEAMERKDAIRAIKDASTSSAADNAVAFFLERWDLPPDFDVLISVLNCSEEEYVYKAIELLEEILESRRAPRRTNLLEQRLRKIKTLSEDPDLQQKADGLIRLLRLHP